MRGGHSAHAKPYRVAPVPGMAGAEDLVSREHTRRCDLRGWRRPGEGLKGKNGFQML
jgi:hypothetical protein